MIRIAAALMLVAALPAAAQEGASGLHCRPHEGMAAWMAKEYSEFVRIVARAKVGSEQYLMEVFVSDKGTFSVMMTDTRMKSCMVAAGDAWTENALPETGRGA